MAILAVTLPVFATAPLAEYDEPEITLPYELKRICSCESTGSPDNEPIQYNADGSVLRGRINPQDVGMCQINEHYWLQKSEDLGYNIYTEEGNKLMAIWIYEQSGTAPWKWSKPCHNS